VTANALFDHFIGKPEQRRWYHQPQLFGRLEIHRQRAVLLSPRENRRYPSCATGIMNLRRFIG
jgi:hypothetical protein